MIFFPTGLLNLLRNRSFRLFSMLFPSGFPVRWDPDRPKPGLPSPLIHPNSPGLDLASKKTRW